MASQLAVVVGTFNVNTNRWAKRYVFKRLRFLGNKHVSSFATLFFLAIWHGLHPGYFLTFGMEFLDMEAERRVVVLWRRATGGKPLSSGPLSMLLTVVGWLWVCLQLTYGLVGMEMRALAPGWLIWSRLGFFGFRITIGLIVLTVLVNLVFRPSRPPATITTVVSDTPSTTAALPTDTKGKVRRASVLEEVDELKMVTEKMVGKVGELLDEDTPPLPVE